MAAFIATPSRTLAAFSLIATLFLVTKCSRADNSLSLHNSTKNSDLLFDYSKVDARLNEVDTDEDTFLHLFHHEAEARNESSSPPTQLSKDVAATARFNLAPVRADLNTALTFLTAPQLALNLLVNRFLQWLGLSLMWYWLHFLFWDYTQTLPAERFSMQALVTVLKNPNVQLYNVMNIWLTVGSTHLRTCTV